MQKITKANYSGSALENMGFFQALRPLVKDMFGLGMLGSRTMQRKRKVIRLRGIGGTLISGGAIGTVCNWIEIESNRHV